MRKVIKVKVITGSKAKDLNLILKEGLEKGYQPLGGVSASLSDTYVLLAQTMVMYEEA